MYINLIYLLTEHNIKQSDSKLSSKSSEILHFMGFHDFCQHIFLAVFGENKSTDDFILIGIVESFGFVRSEEPIVPFTEFGLSCKVHFQPMFTSIIVIWFIFSPVEPSNWVTVITNPDAFIFFVGNTKPHIPVSLFTNEVVIEVILCFAFGDGKVNIGSISGTESTGFSDIPKSIMNFVVNTS